MYREKSARATVRVGKDAAGLMQLLDRQESEGNAEYAYRVLSYNILMLNIPPAAFIQETRIGEKLGMSKGPVHQAIMLLRGNSLVDVKPRSATHVSLINLDAVSQGFFLRSAVEPAVFTELQKSHSQECIVRLAENVAAQRHALVKENFDVFSFIHLDDEFHHIIYIADNKSLIWDSLKKVTSHFDRIRYMGLILGYEKAASSEHEYLLDLLSGKRDISVEDTKIFIVNHLKHYQSYLDQMVDDHPSYFRTK